MVGLGGSSDAVDTAFDPLKPSGLDHPVQRGPADACLFGLALGDETPLTLCEGLHLLEGSSPCCKVYRKRYRAQGTG